MLLNRAGLIFFLVTSFSALFIAVGQPQTRHPNILLLIGDDHAAYALGCYGSRMAKTPNLDRLAAEGALFKRAYCNSPVCTPSRQSLLTGRLPHAVGVTLLKTALSDREITLADHLKTSGYATAAIGKMHFNSQLRHGFDLRIDLAEHQANLRKNPPPPLPQEIKTLGPWRPFQDPARIWLNGEYLPVPAREADMDATFFANEAAKFLRQPRQQPFFLVVSFYQPHSPFQFPIEYAGLYDPEKFDVPKVGPEDSSQVPLIFRDLTDMDKRRITAAYHTSVAFLDKNLGQVLNALKESGQFENTLVIYVGDHGYNLGHHGRFEKHAFNEEAVHAPLLVRWPGRIPAGKKVDSLTEFVDIFPTINEAAGLSLPPDRHGKSLLPLLTGRIIAPARGQFVVSQYHENEEAMVRTDRWKLIYGSGKRAREDGYRTDNPTPGRYKKLYDLETDPGEFHNLANAPGQVRRIRELESILLNRLESTSPLDLKAPQNLPIEEKLDWYLIPPEVHRESLRK